MAEFASNGKANAALATGIIGATGVGATLLNGGLNGLFGGWRNGNCGCNEDHVVDRYEAGQAAWIAQLETEVKLRDVEDIRDELPGKVWIDEDGNADTDMDIVSDENGDLSALFGIRTGDSDPDFYKDFPHPFSGSVYEIAGTDIKVITIKNWL